MRKRHNEGEYIACAILAGGENSRMARHKAFLDCHGRTFIEVIVDKMRQWFDDILIVTNSKVLFTDMDVQVFEDIIPHKGPIGGLYTALSLTNKERVFCIACDMPFFKDDILQRIIQASERQEFDCYVPRSRFGLEPLFAIYRRRIRDLVKKGIESERLSIANVLEGCRTSYIDIHDKDALININTPEEYIYYADKIKDMD